MVRVSNLLEIILTIASLRFLGLRDRKLLSSRRQLFAPSLRVFSGMTENDLRSNIVFVSNLPKRLGLDTSLIERGRVSFFYDYLVNSEVVPWLVRGDHF